MERLSSTRARNARCEPHRNAHFRRRRRIAGSQNHFSIAAWAPCPSLHTIKHHIDAGNSRKTHDAPRIHPATAHAPCGLHRVGRRLQQVRMSSAPLSGSTSYAIDPASYSNAPTPLFRTVGWGERSDAHHPGISGEVSIERSDQATRDALKRTGGLGGHRYAHPTLRESTLRVDLVVARTIRRRVTAPMRPMREAGSRALSWAHCEFSHRFSTAADCSSSVFSSTRQQDRRRKKRRRR